MAGGTGGGGAAGGVGYTGQPGTGGSGAGGGGGGSAGGVDSNGLPVIGGAGGDGGGGKAGGAGGIGGTSSASPNGTAGAAPPGVGGGAGGGGGGYFGYSGAGSSALLTNQTFTGGSGGAGGDGGAFGDGGGGGAGGYGAIVMGTMVPIAATVQGGAGGDGGGGLTPGNAGDGGIGLLSNATSGAMVTNQTGGVIGGGTGGAAATASANSVAGAGGTGITVSGSTATVSNMGSVSGGNGGSSSGSGPGGLGGVGILIKGAQATVSNYGSARGGAGSAGGEFGSGGAGAAGVAFTTSGGYLMNQRTGTISGGAGGFAGGVTRGSGAGAGGAGVVLASDDAVMNAGMITGAAGGNSSTVGGSGGAGIDFTGSGDTLINQAKAVVSGGAGGTALAGGTAGAGGIGVVFAAGGDLINAGAIKGAGAAGVSGGGLVIVDTGTISGTTTGDAITFTGGSNILALGAQAGMEGSKGLTGALDIKAGTLTFEQESESTGLPADVTVSAPIIGKGAVVETETGTLTLSGANTYSGGTTINAGTLDLATTSGAGTGAINFAPMSGNTATLALDRVAQPGNDQMFGDTLANFGASDQLDLKGLGYSGAATTQEAYTVSSTMTSPSGTTTTSGVLSVVEDGTTEDFNLSGITVGETFFASSDSSGGTEITATVCFATGTAIRTARGDVPVEALAVGDLAVTASGALRPIRWIGQRTIDCAAHPVPSEAWPVRVLAGAFGADLPERDLYLSPGHPVLVGSGPNEVLVPIMCLINGTSIARKPVDEVTYWHVELNEHDILLAEGLPAESFLDYGNRPWFADGADHALLHPDFVAPGLAGRCRPVAIDGPQVEAERRRIDGFFELRLAGQCAWPEADNNAWMM